MKSNYCFDTCIRPQNRQSYRTTFRTANIMTGDGLRPDFVMKLPFFTSPTNHAIISEGYKKQSTYSSLFCTRALVKSRAKDSETNWSVIFQPFPPTYRLITQS